MPRVRLSPIVYILALVLPVLRMIRNNTDKTPTRFCHCGTARFLPNASPFAHVARGNRPVGSIRRSCAYIQSCAEKLEKLEFDFAKDPHLVHHTVGPSRFTEVLEPACKGPQKEECRVYLLKEQRPNIWHAVASAGRKSWGKGWPSWRVERMNIANWSSINEH